MQEEIKLLEQRKTEALRLAMTLHSEACSKEAKLEAFVQKWLNDESELNNESMQQLLDSVNLQVAELKKKASEADAEWKRLDQEIALKENALYSVRTNLGMNPDEIVITGGVLSPNASESHLIGRSKTLEELELDRQNALAMIREKVAKKEITLAHASKLKNDVNIAYGYAPQQQENQNGMSK